MTVAELIAKLQEMPQDIHVVSHDIECGGDVDADVVLLLPYGDGRIVKIGPSYILAYYEMIDEGQNNGA